MRRTVTALLPKSHLPAAEQTGLWQAQGFTGLDRRDGIGAARLTEAEGIDPCAYPALASAKTPTDTGIRLPAGKQLSLCCVGEELLGFTNVSGAVLMTRIRQDGSQRTVMIGTNNTDTPRTAVRFNRYTNPLDPLSGEFVRAVIIFPDALCYDIDEDADPLPLAAGGNILPDMAQATVHLSRLFGAQGDHLYASAYNAPADFDLDTASDTGAANAWASVVQSDMAGGFTAMTVFDGHVLAMKPDRTYVVNNNKNPFRIAELLRVGAASAATVGVSEDSLFFASAQEVYRYDGGSLYPIGAPLDRKDYTGAFGCAGGGLYYLALPGESTVYVYDPEKDGWGALGCFGDAPVCAMASDGKNAYFLTEDGRIYTDRSAPEADFFCKTAPIVYADAHSYRPLRPVLCFTLEEGGHVQLSVLDSTGNETPVFEAVGHGGIQVCEGRNFTPRDNCFSLIFRGRGHFCLHSFGIRLRTDS